MRSSKAGGEGGNLETGLAGEFVTVREAVQLTGKTLQGIRRACAEMRLACETVVDNGGPQYRIALGSLIAVYQLDVRDVTRWYTKNRLGIDPSMEGVAIRAEAHNDRERERARAARNAGQDAPKLNLAPVPITAPEEVDALWDRFNRATAKNQERARKAVEMLLIFDRMKAEGRHIDREIVPFLRAEFGRGASAPTLWRLRGVVEGQPRDLWAPLLLAGWKGKTAVAEIPEAVWNYFMGEWGVTSEPDVQGCYDRTKRWAAANSIDKLPSCDTFARRIKALPLEVRTLLRKGPQALQDLFPPMRRDYSTLAVHELWCSDARKADVHCRWPDGSVARPYLVAWEDLRTRVVLGWRIGKDLNADLVRLAFKDAAETARALPRYGYLDNGREYAAKVMTGGAATRYRFKVKEDEVPGMLTVLGVETIWALPYNGREKPIESFWNTIARRVDKRAEFAGAYCGKDTVSKPEDFDRNKAVPIEAYMAAVAEEMESYHARAHRGDGMNGQTPRTVYEDLIQSTPVRQVTPRALSCCLMRRENVKPDRNGIFTVMGNGYWSKETVGLERTFYTVAYDPEDLHRPLEISRNGRFICTAQIAHKTGFRDGEAAREYKKSRNAWKKAVKQQADAARGLLRAELADFDDPTPDAPPAAPETGESRLPLPLPKVVEPLRRAEAMTTVPRPDTDDEEGLSDDEIERRLSAARARRTAEG